MANPNHNADRSARPKDVADPDPPQADRLTRLPGWVINIVVSVGSVALVLAAAFGGLLLPGLLLLFGLDEPALRELPTIVPVVIRALSHLLTLVIAVVGCAVVARLTGRRLRNFGWRWNRRSAAALLVGLGTSALIVFGIYLLTTGAGLGRTVEADPSGAPLWAGLVTGVTAAVLLQGIPEELIFRGMFLTTVRLRPIPAVLASGAVFAIIHLLSSGGQQGWVERLLFLAMPLGFGLAAGALVVWTRSLWSGVGIHSGLHLAMLSLAFFDTPSGPWFWVLAAAAWTLIALVVLALVHRRRDSKIVL